MSVESFVDAVEEQVNRDDQGLHSFMLVRRGEVVAEGWWHPYRADRPHRLFSLSKSFTSTAVGFAVADGRFALDDPVAGFFPHGGDPRMRVRHLLTMTTGHGEDTLDLITHDDDWARAFLRLPLRHEPGTRFVYNSGASYLLSAIVQRTTGETLLDYLRPRLFEPLGFGPVTWETCPLGVSTGGWGLNLRTADIARFGRLYLAGGSLDGAAVLPAGWAAAATARQVPTPEQQNPDWQQGYGYQFWRSRHGAYRGDGAFGQLCVVLPEQQTVLAATAGLVDMQAVLDLVWAHLLHDDTTPDESVLRRLRHLRLAPLRGHSGAGAGSGTATGTFSVADPQRSRPDEWRPSHERPPTIRSMAFAPVPDGWLVTLEDEAGTQRYRCIDNDWHVAGDAASTGAWTGPDEFTLRVCTIIAPFVRTYVCTFSGDALTIRPRDNVSFGPTVYPTVHAKRTEW